MYTWAAGPGIATCVTLALYMFAATALWHCMPMQAGVHYACKAAGTKFAVCMRGYRVVFARFNCFVHDFRQCTTSTTTSQDGRGGAEAEQLQSRHGRCLMYTLPAASDASELLDLPAGPVPVQPDLLVVRPVWQPLQQQQHCSELHVPL